VYDLAAEQIAMAVDMLLNHKELAVQDPDVGPRRSGAFENIRRWDFSDCLVVEIARKSGHLPMGAFDRDLAKLDGVKAHPLMTPLLQSTLGMRSSPTFSLTRMRCRRISDNRGA